MALWSAASDFHISSGVGGRVVLTFNPRPIRRSRSGVAAAEFLARRGARVTVNDAKPEAELNDAPRLRAQGIDVVAGAHPLALFENADLIVASPGVPLALPPFGAAYVER